MGGCRGNDSVAGTTPGATPFSSNRGVCFESRDAGHGTRGGASRFEARSRPIQRARGALGVTLARRAAREPSYRETYADLAARGDAARGGAAAAKRAASALTAPRRGMGGEPLAGHAAFFAAREAGYGAATCRADRAVRAASPPRSSGRETTNGGGGGRGERKRLWDVTVAQTGVRGDVVASAATRRDASARRRGRGGERSGARRRAGCRLGGRARFPPRPRSTLDRRRLRADGARQRARGGVVSARRGSARARKNRRRRRVSARSSRRAARDASLGRARGGVGRLGWWCGEGSVAAAARRQRVDVSASDRRCGARTASSARAVAADEGERRGRWVGTTRKTDRVRVNLVRASGWKIGVERTSRGRASNASASAGRYLLCAHAPTTAFRERTHATPYTLHTPAVVVSRVVYVATFESPRRVSRRVHHHRPWDTVATNRGGFDSTPASSIRFAPSPFARRPVPSLLPPRRRFVSHARLRARRRKWTVSSPRPRGPGGARWKSWRPEGTRGTAPSVRV